MPPFPVPPFLPRSRLSRLNQGQTKTIDSFILGISEMIIDEEGESEPDEAAGGLGRRLAGKWRHRRQAPRV